MTASSFTSTAAPPPPSRPAPRPNAVCCPAVPSRPMARPLPGRGLSDLIAAETEVERRQALDLMRGYLGVMAAGRRKALVSALARNEAAIEFGHEYLAGDLLAEAAGLFGPVEAEFGRERDGGARVPRRVLAGVGRPNGGKSTLLNALARRHAAIASTEAGTTREVVDVRLGMGRLAVSAQDMGGIREPPMPVESLGAAGAPASASAADIRVFLLMGAEVGNLEVARMEGDLGVAAKSDLRLEVHGPSVSGRTGAALPELGVALQDSLAARPAGVGAALRARQMPAIEGA